MNEQVVADALEEMWKAYFDSDRKTIKPPTLDRITRKLMTNDYFATRIEVQLVLKSGFAKIREKDNCGISWNCFCWKESKYLEECLKSKNRVKEGV